MSGVLDKNRDFFTGDKPADDFHVAPVDRRQLGLPIVPRVRPDQPRRPVRLPLRGHAKPQGRGKLVVRIQRLAR